MRYWLQESVYKKDFCFFFNKLFFSVFSLSLSFEAKEVSLYNGVVMEKTKRSFERLKILFGEL